MHLCHRWFVANKALCLRTRRSSILGLLGSCLPLWPRGIDGRGGLLRCRVVCRAGATAQHRQQTRAASCPCCLRRLFIFALLLLLLPLTFLMLLSLLLLAALLAALLLLLPRRFAPLPVVVLWGHGHFQQPHELLHGKLWVGGLQTRTRLDNKVGGRVEPGEERTRCVDAREASCVDKTACPALACSPKLWASMSGAAP